ncbi:MAG: AAA family ATPase, partial [Acidobacteria bacterium]|nr:AAA family ATPase [Acidobacteriota bacterium]
ITNSKAKKKAERVSTANRNATINYDRQEYINRLTIAAREIGIVCDDDSPEVADESLPPLLQLMNQKSERLADGEEMTPCPIDPPDFNGLATSHY